jgi:hypothetical protein
MPATLDTLARSLVDVPAPIVERLATFMRASRHPFRELVDPALELLGGVIPDWPLLSDWNRWCLASGALEPGRWHGSRLVLIPPPAAPPQRRARSAGEER